MARQDDTTAQQSLIPSLDERVFIEQITLLNKNQPTIYFVTVAAACLLIYMLRTEVRDVSLGLWIGGIFLIYTIRIILWLTYTTPLTLKLAQRYAKVAVVGAFVAGVWWGAGSLILYTPDSILHQIIYLFIVSILGTGALSSMTIYVPAFYAYFPVSLLPTMVHYFYHHDLIHTGLAVAIVLYIFGLTVFGRNFGRALKQSLKNRFENLALINALTIEKEQAEHLREQAEQANRDKSKFLAAASHDLRQPLHALGLFVNVLSHRAQQPQEKLLAENIHNSTFALKNLLDGLLDVSRLDAGIMSCSRINFPVQQLFQRLQKDYAPVAQEREIHLVFKPTRMIVNTDPGLLERVLRNLISNAIRYTVQGSVLIGCRYANRDSVRIEIRDSGIGIPQDKQEEIFKEFTQLNNPERDRSKGLGLGLAIVRRLADLLAAPLALKSRPGQGTTFSIDIPRGDAAAVALPVATLSDTVVDLNQSFILVIDDERAIRTGMTQILEQWGCTVLSAGSESEALSLLDREGILPDAIIADYRLRDNRTGADAITHIQQMLDVTLPALIITGDTSPQRLKEANASGYDLLHKPVQLDALKAWLNNTL